MDCSRNLRKRKKGVYHVFDLPITLFSRSSSPPLSSPKFLVICFGSPEACIVFFCLLSPFFVAHYRINRHAHFARLSYHSQSGESRQNKYPDGYDSP